MPPIPPTAFFLGYSATVAACLYWHNRQASRHLVTMAWGMGLVAFLSVPSVFAEWVSYAELARYAKMILKSEEGLLSRRETDLEPGYRLLNYCYYLSGIGVLAFALGLSRFAKDLVLKSAYPSPDQA